MSESKSSGTSSGGIGIAGGLGLLFVGLKLGGVIAWSWLWVLAPFWIPFVVVVALIGVYWTYLASVASRLK
jgi:hypothetical protein